MNESLKVVTVGNSQTTAIANLAIAIKTTVFILTKLEYCTCNISSSKKRLVLYK